MLLIENLDLIATMNDEGDIIKNANIVVDGPSIKMIGKSRDSIDRFDNIIDGKGKMALPGFVNTHHHFFQQLTRALPAVHNSSILNWLLNLYPIWREIGEEEIYYATQLSIAQLLLTGCTTTSDMAYLYPRKQVWLIDQEIKAAKELGIRFHPCRASMPSMEGNLSEELQTLGVNTTDLIEDTEIILSECERVIRTYDQSGPFSMCRVAIGQTDKTYRDPVFMRAMADLAERYGVMLHTHLHPREDEIVLCRELHGLEPIDFLDEVGWLGKNTWVAHATNFTPEIIRRVSNAGTGISHSPSSNMRLSYQTAPIPAMTSAGVKISIAVDGGASNDTGDYLGELRQTLLVHRIPGLHPAPFSGVTATTPYDVLRMGTRGGAEVLNRNDIGSLEVGKAADIVLYDLNNLGFAGALHDPLAALLLCGESHIIDTSIINGEILIRNGKLTKIREEKIVRGANLAASRLIKRASQVTGIDYDSVIYQDIN